MPPRPSHVLTAGTPRKTNTTSGTFAGLTTDAVRTMRGSEPWPRTSSTAKMRRPGRSDRKGRTCGYAASYR
eukprot:7271093-Heterocapsa_arctica.AAC.1